MTIGRFSFVAIILICAICLGCAERLDFFECDNDNDCKSHPAAAPGTTLHCNRSHVCIEGSPAASLCTATYPNWTTGNELVIGALVNRDYGNDNFLLESYKIALDEINSIRMGLGVEPLVLRYCEINSDKSDPKKAMQILSRDSAVLAVVGPTNSRDVIAVKDVVIQNGLGIVSPAATSPEISLLSDDGRGVALFFRVVTSDVVQGPVLTAIAMEDVRQAKEKPNFALVYADDEYGRGFQTAVLRRLDALGQTARPVLAYPEPVGGAAQDVINKVVDMILSTNEKIDLLAIPNRHSTALLQSIAEHPRAASVRRIIMGEGGKNESVLQLLSSSKENVRNLVAQLKGSAPTVNSAHPNFSTFEKAFQKKTGVESNSTVFTAFAYDAMYALGLAIGSYAEHPSRDQVRARLGAINGCISKPANRRHISVGGNKYEEGWHVLQTQSGGIVLDGLSGEICFTPHGDRVDGNYEQWWLNKDKKTFEQKPAVP